MYRGGKRGGRGGLTGPVGEWFWDGGVCGEEFGGEGGDCGLCFGGHGPGGCLFPSELNSLYPAGVGSTFSTLCTPLARPARPLLKPIILEAISMRCSVPRDARCRDVVVVGWRGLGRETFQPPIPRQNSIRSSTVHPDRKSVV